MTRAEHRRRRSPWLLLLVAVVITGAAGAAVAVGVSRQRGATPALPDDTTVVRVRAGTAEHPLDVLFVGDSITYGYFASQRRTSFAALLARYWRGSTPLESTAVGVPGARAYAIAAAMTSKLDDGVGLVVVEAGTNDERQASPLDEFAASYARLLATIRGRAPHAALVCAGVWGSGSRARAFDAVILRSCRADGGAFRSLEAAYDVRADRGTAGYPTWLGPADDFHPDDAGHAAIAHALAGGVAIEGPG